jgi:hypothetical protein
MTIRQFTKTQVIIYKSHLLKNNFISVTFAHRFDATTVSKQKTLIIEKTGGAAESLKNYFETQTGF